MLRALITGVLSCALAWAVLLTPAAAQQPRWSQAEIDHTSGGSLPGLRFMHKPSSVPTPTKRDLCGLTQLPGSGGDGVLLFGGNESKTAPKFLGDTWSWNGKYWKPVHGPSPSARESVLMVYDLLRDESVLFGGWDGGGYPVDTWTFDGSGWTKEAPAVKPGGRDWAAMAYDNVNFSTVLFGGHTWMDSVAGLGPKGDTWVWDGAQWTDMTPGLAVSPPARNRHAMSYDANTGMVILMGGSASFTSNDMWGWNGTTWTQLTPPTLPPARLDPQLAFDYGRNKLVLHGGSPSWAVGDPALTDTWEWDGLTWTQVTTGPGISSTQMVYDFARSELVLFGGSTVANWDGCIDTTWTYGN